MTYKKLLSKEELMIKIDNIFNESYKETKNNIPHVLRSLITRISVEMYLKGLKDGMTLIESITEDIKNMIENNTFSK
jgi:Glu-tRNA(Gln) amidotransferase subunit E-like FAD-binding protein